ncbi:MAG: UDP-glucose 4-epimerase GalE [Lentisphaerae bacterium]|nr:MAG: UDP-glucose 4-epimerase GalE [Lentisphaerota bacterium]
MKILVTGGTGYIGSHTVVELLQAGHETVIIDNLCNSHINCLDRIQQITGRRPDFYQIDVGDYNALVDLMKNAGFDAVIHFAALKAVGESVQQPLRYYRNNVSGTLTLCQAMQDTGVKRIVFSSSATVYGDPHKVPITEDFPLQATNPYGRTKLMMEYILRDLHHADPSFQIALLRYFNPVGAHPSGLIGEDPNGIPNNLMPYITQVAVGKLPKLRVFGNDYPTRDGTGVRDYIHVVDLAKGHLCALEKLMENPGTIICNLGTGRGYSVLEMIKAFARASGKEIPYEIVERRPGDVAECYADPSLAEKILGWKATRGIEEMCADAWRWQSRNPNGYREP